MQAIRSNKLFDFKLIIYFSAVMLLYIIGIKYDLVGQLVGCVSFGICVLYLLFNKPEKAFLHFILNLTFSIESVQFATGQSSGVIIHSFIILPYITILGVFAVNVFIFIQLILKEKKNFKTIFPRFCVNFCIYIIVEGIIMLLITLMINDNRITNVDWYYSSARSELFRMFMLVITIINSLLIINKNQSDKNELSRWMVAMLCSLSIVGFIAEIFDIHGYRMGATNVSALPLFAFFGVGLIAFFKAADNSKDKIITCFFTGSLLVLMILKSTPLGGKWFIAILMIIIFLIYAYTDSVKGIFLGVSIILLIVAIINTNLVESILSGNYYMLKKYDEFKTLFKYAGNLSQSDASIAFRLDEINNVLIEISKNPLYLIFGKGIVGTSLHHTALYSWSASGTFSNLQSSYGIFFQMHESLAVILLKYGLIGVGGFIYALIRGFKAIKSSPWAMIGVIWLTFYFGSYNSMLFGAVCLVMALHDCKNQNSSVHYGKKIRALSVRNQEQIL